LLTHVRARRKSGSQRRYLAALLADSRPAARHVSYFIDVASGKKMAEDRSCAWLPSAHLRGSLLKP
jgi:hypothetical protein